MVDKYFALKYYMEIADVVFTIIVTVALILHYIISPLLSRRRKNKK